MTPRTQPVDSVLEHMGASAMFGAFAAFAAA